MSDVRQTILRSITEASGKKSGRIWHNGKWHSETSDELPVHIRPLTPAEKEANERSLRKWLEDAAADPAGLKKKLVIGGGSVGLGAYAMRDDSGKKRK